MIKKTIGIATILLLILGIVIGIAKANTKTAKLLKHGGDALVWKVDKGDHLLLDELKALTLQEHLVEKGLLAAAVKNGVKPDALLDAKLKDATLVKLDDDLGSLVLEGLWLTDSWNKDVLWNV